MDLNAISPSSQWDWEHQSFFNAKATEYPKLQPPSWSIEQDREINVGLFDTPGGSGIFGSASRSSKSASNSSSLNRNNSKTCIFACGNSHTPELSSVSGEPLLTLLGKRVYIEDVCPKSDSKNLSFSRDLASSLSIGKKCKFNSQNLQFPRCQVEGCGLDLSSAKDYHRKRRVCESHSKSPMVVIDGMVRRFCQQCGRFHNLAEFDEKKRSCREQLSRHNARRRKHQPEALQSSQSVLSSRCDGKQQMSPFANSKTATNLAWQNMQNSKLPQAKDFLLKPAKDNANTQGVEDFITVSDTNDEQDFICALSLLSTNPWDSYATKSMSLEHSNRPTSAVQAVTHPMSQRMPLA
ncbi:squamosa promoter-binding-like protein 2 [Medicago truncatula]|uniref:squamosa promoter-binding-like protein 2 n=1 Tax=Medicago truncatula TaxID=3880 RepID=UPI000D2F3B5F|nr:squamosa promoter-binding-like protein 2 [Medicago truncatula]